MSYKRPQEEKNTDIQFWNQQWDNMAIGFHRADLHPMLEKHIQLLLENRQHLRFFFPLCGKAIDMRWLASLGHYVVGIESNQMGIQQFFLEGDIKYRIEDKDDLRLYISENNQIKIYSGDFFKLKPEYEEPFDCVWDRGSLVALPEEVTQRYADHIFTLLSPNFRYLLDTFDYNKELYAGPPHAVDFNDVKQLYGKKCSIQYVDSAMEKPFSEKLKDNLPKEVVYLLKPLN